MAQNFNNLVDIGIKGGDSFSIVNSIATLEKNCLSENVLFKDDRIDKQPDGFFELTIGKDKFAMNKITTRTETGDITSVHASRIIDVPKVLSGVSKDNYNKFSKSILSGSGLYVLAGAKTSNLKSFSMNLSLNLSKRGLSIVRIARLGDKFTYRVDGANIVVGSVSALKELIALYKYNVVMVDATASSELIKMAIYLGELGFTCIVEISSRSGCHAIEALNRSFGAKRFSSIVRSILFVGAVPKVKNTDFKNLQFRDDDRYSFWEKVPYAPRADERILQCEDFRYAKKLCTGKILLCELIGVDADVANEILQDKTARDYITTFSLDPAWRSIYSLAVRVVKDTNTTIDFVDFFIGRY
ncbi:hypothetical protein [Photobacterium damselae]|uniref:hypothetical protein n=1 Tax=Photobacterium damselae TaxID=38293 RepID=UPI0040683AEA